MGLVHTSHISEKEYVAHHLNHWQLNLHTMKIGDGGGFWTLNLDTLAVSIFLGLFFFFVFFIATRRLTTGIPGKFQNFIEAIIEFIQKLVRESFHGESRLVAPLSLTIFIWVFLMNAMDLIPVDLIPRILEYFGINDFRVVPTDDPNLTFAMSFSVFLLMIFYSFRSKGIIGFSKEILTTPFGKWLFPINIFFNLLEFCVKPLSLSLRLYGNMFAGELIFILIAFIMWQLQWVVGVVWTLFHVMVISIQAFIFMMLSIIYLSLANQHHE